MNEVEEVIKELKTNPGFSAYVIMNNDGECAPRAGKQGRKNCEYYRPIVGVKRKRAQEGGGGGEKLAAVV